MNERLHDDRTMMILIILAIGTFLVGLVLGWFANDALEPHCPTEDSCQVDYQDGRWHITEVTP